MDSGGFNFLIVRDDECGIFDLFNFFLNNDQLTTASKFLHTSSNDAVADDHRWVIVVSIIARKIIKVFGKPMEWTGYLLEFFLNLLSLNGNFLGLLYNFLKGDIIIPKRGSETFISAIGHLDGRLELYNIDKSCDANVGMGNRALMDLCMMASKLAYENEKVVRNVVQLYWKMHFVAFYNCWNEYQKERSTQVFIMCDKPKDASLILISFRGTEPFDADDWITDFDYSWYEIPELGKVHMGFLEALGLGNRANPSSFQKRLLLLQSGNVKFDSELPSPVMMGEMTAYYGVKNKLNKLLKEHGNAKFVITGHSLGGALAILFPTVLVLHNEEEMMQRLLGVYTYGQPRVGDQEMGKYMESHLEHPQSKYFRVVYCNDLVPRLPYDNKTFLYKHFGICLYYDSFYVEQKVDEEPNRNYFGFRYLIPEYVNAVWELVRSLMMGCAYGPDYKESWESFVLRMVGLAIPGLSAHSPVEYVNSIRLGRRRRRSSRYSLD